MTPNRNRWALAQKRPYNLSRDGPESMPRRRRESNPLIAVLQTAAFPLGYTARNSIIFSHKGHKETTFFQ